MHRRLRQLVIFHTIFAHFHDVFMHGNNGNALSGYVLNNHHCWFFFHWNSFVFELIKNLNKKKIINCFEIINAIDNLLKLCVFNLSMECFRGSAIAKIVGRNAAALPAFDDRVTMYVFEEMINGKKLTEIINETHENVKYLPGHILPPNVVSLYTVRMWIFWIFTLGSESKVVKVFFKLIYVCIFISLIRYQFFLN